MTEADWLEVFAWAHVAWFALCLGWLLCVMILDRPPTGDS